MTVLKRNVPSSAPVGQTIVFCGLPGSEAASAALIVQFPHLTAQQIYSYHVPLAVTLLVLTAVFATIETLRRRR
jgi:hypothetical protein